MQEIWKDIPGYEGKYQSSDLGRIKSLSRKILLKNSYYGNKKEIILKQTYDHHGYLQLQLYNEGKEKTFKVHKLVAITFLNNPKYTVNHKNGVKDDNRLENLEWNTLSENNIHKYKVLGFKGNMYGKTGIKNHKSKKINQYDLDGNFIKTWDGLRDASRILNILHQNISRCCRGLGKTAGGFKWEYFNN